LFVCLFAALGFRNPELSELILPLFNALYILNTELHFHSRTMLFLLGS